MLSIDIFNERLSPSSELLNTARLVKSTCDRMVVER